MQIFLTNFFLSAYKHTTCFFKNILVKDLGRLSSEKDSMQNMFSFFNPLALFVFWKTLLSLKMRDLF